MNRRLIALSLATSLTFTLPILNPECALADGIMSDTSTGSRAADGMADKSIGSSPSRFEKASPAQQSIASGHFARARSLLVAALNEFDSGVAKADPSSLIDTGMFREGIKARARELERLLDPQARESETGVKFSADSRLLKRK